MVLASKGGIKSIALALIPQHNPPIDERINHVLFLTAITAIYVGDISANGLACSDSNIGADKSEPRSDNVRDAG